MKAIIPIVAGGVIALIISSAIHSDFRLPWPSKHREKPEWQIKLDAENERIREEAAAQVQRILTEADKPTTIKAVRDREEASLKQAVQREEQAIREATKRAQDDFNRAVYEAAGELR